MRRSITRLCVGLLLVLPASSPVQAGEPRSIEVGITTHLGDRQSFVDGDRISFLLSLESDAYVYLFYRTAEAQLVQLLPNERMSDHFFGAGLFMPVPSAQQAFQFTVQPPYGEEAIYAVASDNGKLSFPGNKLANGLILLDGVIEAIVGRIKANSTRLFGRGDLRLTTKSAR